MEQPHVFSTDRLRVQMEESGQAWLQFLSVPTLRAGIYSLAAGATDEQKPHDKDELYYVLEGKAGISIDDKKWTVRKGDVIFVPAQAQHQFQNITEDIHLLVFFSEADP